MGFIRMSVSIPENTKNKLEEIARNPQIFPQVALWHQKLILRYYYPVENPYLEITY